MQGPSSRFQVTNTLKVTAFLICSTDLLDGESNCPSNMLRSYSHLCLSHWTSVEVSWRSWEVRHWARQLVSLGKVSFALYLLELCGTKTIARGPCCSKFPVEKLAIVQLCGYADDFLLDSNSCSSVPLNSSQLAGPLDGFLFPSSHSSINHWTPTPLRVTEDKTTVSEKPAHCSSAGRVANKTDFPTTSQTIPLEQYSMSPAPTGIAAHTASSVFPLLILLIFVPNDFAQLLQHDLLPMRSRFNSDRVLPRQQRFQSHWRSLDVVFKAPISYFINLRVM